MSALDAAVVRVCLWQLRLLARLTSRVPLPYLLEQDDERVPPPAREFCLDMLGAWHAGMRLRDSRQESRWP